METRCSKPDCTRPAKTRGMCKGHYETWRMLNRGEVRRRKSKWFLPDGSRMPCSYGDCPKPVQSQGLCSQHYQNFWYESTRGQNVSRKNRKWKDSDGNRLERVCEFPDCRQPQGSSHGLCPGHANQRRKGRELRPLHEWVDCPVNGCEGQFSSTKTVHGVCRAHSALAKKYGLSARELVSLFEAGTCSNPSCSASSDLFIDHDHSCCAGPKSCGKCVRGVLCRTCNFALGFAEDNLEKLDGLIQYLRENPGGNRGSRTDQED